MIMCLLKNLLEVQDPRFQLLSLKMSGVSCQKLMIALQCSAQYRGILFLYLGKTELYKYVISLKIQRVITFKIFKILYNMKKLIAEFLILST